MLSASKGGVVSLTIEAARELKRYGIKVNTVAPGGMTHNIQKYQPEISQFPED